MNKKGVNIELSKYRQNKRAKLVSLFSFVKYVIADKQKCQWKLGSLKAYIKQLTLAKKQSSKTKPDSTESYKPKQRGLKCSKEGVLF